MKSLLNVSMSASGSPSEVIKRITDQVQSQGTTGTPEQSAALGAARAYIEKAIAGVSEDDTLAVNAVISISVADAPPVVSQKIKDLTDQLSAAKAALAGKDTVAPVTGA